MGFFSSFNPIKAITRAVGISDKISRPLQAIVTPTTLIGGQLGDKLLGQAFARLNLAGSSRSQSTTPNVYTNPGAGYPSYNPTYIAQYPQYAVQPSGSYLGGPQWDYSTYSQTPQAETFYPLGSTFWEQTWEDKVGNALILASR